MKKYLIIITLIALSSITTACNKTTVVPFGEIPDPDLPEIAMIRADPKWGTVVIYNPDTCRKIGDACGFFRLHAFSHEKLQHGLLGEPDDYPPLQQAAADCYAAKYGRANEVHAAYLFLKDKERDPDIRVHGDPEERAERIKACAKEKDNWIG